MNLEDDMPQKYQAREQFNVHVYLLTPAGLLDNGEWNRSYLGWQDQTTPPTDSTAAGRPPRKLWHRRRESCKPRRKPHRLSKPPWSASVVHGWSMNIGGSKGPFWWHWWPWN